MAIRSSSGTGTWTTVGFIGTRRTHVLETALLAPALGFGAPCAFLSWLWLVARRIIDPSVRAQKALVIRRRDRSRRWNASGAVIP
eukprot:g39128.t1